MSKTKAQLEEENDALRALVAAIGELAVPPDPTDQRLAARIIRSICEEVDKYPELLDQLAKDLRERATTVISYIDPDTAILAHAIDTGTPVIVEDIEDDDPCPAVSPWNTCCVMSIAEHAADPRIAHHDDGGDTWFDRGASEDEDRPGHVQQVAEHLARQGRS